MSHYSRNGLLKGLTLLELLVTISILTIIMGVIVRKQSSSNDRLTIVNLADEISLRISQTQVYGVGVKEFSTGSNQFSYPYGMSFNVISPPGYNKTRYLFFVDKDNNRFYNGNSTCQIGPTYECVEYVDITRDNYVKSLCAIMTAGAEDCSVGRVDMTFSRPTTDVNFVFFNTSLVQMNPPNLIGLRILLESSSGTVQSVIVYQSGQSSVSASAGPTCTGTYDCSQWNGNQAACTGNGHSCNWNASQSRCGGNVRSCSSLIYSQCIATPTNCLWQ